MKKAVKIDEWNFSVKWLREWKERIANGEEEPEEYKRVNCLCGQYYYGIQAKKELKELAQRIVNKYNLNTIIS